MTRKRIILSSNYDEDNFTECFFSSYSLPAEVAKTVCDALNTIDPQGSVYYKAVSTDYVLRVREA
jgi:hypothetical protein